MKALIITAEQLYQFNYNSIELGLERNHPDEDLGMFSDFAWEKAYALRMIPEDVQIDDNGNKFYRVYVFNSIDRLLIHMLASDVAILKAVNKKQYDIDDSTLLDDVILKRFLEARLDAVENVVGYFSIIPFCEQRYQELKAEGLLKYLWNMKNFERQIRKIMLEDEIPFDETTSVSVYYNQNYISPYFKFRIDGGGKIFHTDYYPFNFQSSTLNNLDELEFNEPDTLIQEWLGSHVPKAEV